MVNLDDSGIDSASSAYAKHHGVLCARVRWTWGQLVLAALVLLALTLSLAWAPFAAWILLSSLMAMLAAATLGLRLAAMGATAVRDPTIQVAPEALTTIDRSTLPRYSVLVPLYREPEVVPQLIAALQALDYPISLLDIQILIEPDDADTANALAAQRLPAHMRITISPSGNPRTKPRACNTALAQATGDLLVIFDAEDRPDPDQLLKAAIAYRGLPSTVICLQCRLDHYNSQQSLATRWTAIDYLMWFRLVLPGLQLLGAPIPLGGTSNHFRVAALRELGGWDPFNVTEDCDLGMRIARRGWQTRMLASTTWEEAIATVPGWIGQRSRWIKGYLQTWMVHSRSGALSCFGLRGYMLMALSTLGLVGALLVNPIAWITVLLWLIFGWSVVDAKDPLSVASLVITLGLLLANLLIVVIALVTCWRLGRRDLLVAAVVSPGAWVLHSIAAWKAAWEYVVRPFHWEKTQHGQAVQDAGATTTRHALPMLFAAAVLAGAILMLAGKRIEDDVIRQTTVVPEPPPVQLALHYITTEHQATGLIAAKNPNRPKSWTLVTVNDAPACSLGATAPALCATADFPGKTLEMLSRGDRDFGDVAALAMDVQVSVDAPVDLRVSVHWRDEDGRWFEHVSPQRLLPGAWTRFEFPMHDGSAWRGLGHRRDWHHDHLRRISELGIHFFSALAYRGPLTVANFRTLPFPPAPEQTQPTAMTYSVRHEPTTSLAVMTRWRLDFDLGRSWLNPFDPDEVAVDAEITTPDGRNERMPAFYHQEYERFLRSEREVLEAVGAPGWRIDYRPRTTGAYAWRLLVSENGKPGVAIAAGQFTASAAAHHGYIRRSPTKPTLFMRDDGTAYYPIGQNLCQAVDLQQPFRYPFVVPPNQGTYTYDRFFSGMSGAGMNFARVWMTPWSFGLEGNARWQDFYGQGRYSLANAWRLDHLLAEGERLGIDLVLTINHKSEFRNRNDLGAWPDCALNVINSGCLLQAEDFYTNPKVLKLYQQRMRYLVARWGNSPSVAAWELFGEANLIPGYNGATAARWHSELARYVRTIDSNRHLIFTHTHNWQYGNELWALPGIDCVQGNGYIRPPNKTPNHILNFDNYLAEVGHFAKPVLVAEFGGRSELGAPDGDYLEAQMHSGIWASLVEPFAGIALHWWWNFVDGGDLYRHYRGLSTFAAGIDRLAHDYHPVKPLVTSARLAAAGMQDQTSGFYWIYDRGIFESWKGLATTRDAQIVLKDIEPGHYRVEFCDTMDGRVSEARTVELEANTRIPLPPVQRDMALKVTRIP